MVYNIHRATAAALEPEVEGITRMIGYTSDITVLKRIKKLLGSRVL